MRAKVVTWWAHKDGNDPREYEDAWSIDPPGAEADKQISGHYVRVVVADGASESLLAGRWAREVTKAFAAAPVAAVRQAGDFATTAVATARNWPSELACYVSAREEVGRPLMWYEQPGLAKGAFATILALHLCTPRGVEQPAGPVALDRLRNVVSGSRFGRWRRHGRWYAAAFGDTCVFQVRAGALRFAFPLSDSRSFGTDPLTLGSNQYNAELVASRVQFAEGIFVSGDDFYVCTDALAAWFLSQDAKGSRPWETLCGMDEPALASWLSSARKNGVIRNDDVTLVHVKIG